MPSVYDLFTPADELRSTEPSYFRNSSDISTDVTRTAFHKKTPVSVLDEASRRIYGHSPSYQLSSEVQNFGISCSLMGITVRGHARTKKAAKHIAARAMLHHLIDKGYQSECGIPGDNIEEAHRAVDGLAFGNDRIETSNEDPSLSFALNENVPGKLIQLCQRNNFNIPQYRFEEGRACKRSNTQMYLYD
ncbi:hypothetical protein KIN20_013885 [Parelaphostrongylus tenuis]|uniref:DRBM domain-containing protein n=1 Tax=Parelaphostrongylus tenuis TaxID=148309 RepID=A0AAD5MG89_PARTN|nr:hypothetical protein KIN20_013885 [Parelaphostrongylus tenuis]